MTIYPNLDEIFKTYNIILANRLAITTSVRENYCMFHICDNFDDSINIIKRIKPDYYDTAIEFAKGNNIYLFYMFGLL